MDEPAELPERPRRRGIYLLPNLLTTGSLFAGFYGIIASIDGRGVIRSIIGTNPAAGAEVSETVPTNARWRLRSLAASFVTSATAASRYPSLIFDDGATNFYVSDPPELQLASTTSTWQAFPGSARLVAVSGVRQWNAGVPICLQGGFRLRTATTNLQAGDNWGPPQLLVEEWIED